MTEEDRKQLKSNREWIWVELYITIIREEETNDILRTTFRKEDFVCCLGGDEFCIFAKNLEDKELVIRRAIELGKQGRRCYTSPKGDIKVNVSFSIGVVIINNGNKTSYEELYEQADQALYQAKERGRNTYALKEEDL